MQEGADAIYMAYIRHNIMADVNYYTRVLKMLGNSTYLAPDRGMTKVAAEANIKSNVIYIMTILVIIIG